MGRMEKGGSYDTRRTLYRSAPVAPIDFCSLGFRKESVADEADEADEPLTETEVAIRRNYWKCHAFFF